MRGFSVERIDESLDEFDSLANTQDVGRTTALDYNDSIPSIHLSPIGSPIVFACILEL